MCDGESYVSTSVYSQHSIHKPLSHSSKPFVSFERQRSLDADLNMCVISLHERTCVERSRSGTTLPTFGLLCFHFAASSEKITFDFMEGMCSFEVF